MNRKPHQTAESLEGLFHDFKQIARQLSTSARALERTIERTGGAFSKRDQDTWIKHQQIVREAEARLVHVWKSIKPALHRYHTTKTGALFAALDRVPSYIKPEFINERISLVEQIISEAEQRGSTAPGDGVTKTTGVARPKRTTQSQAAGSVPPCLESEARSGNSRTEHWVTAREYAKMRGLGVQTLANWRHADKVAGRDGAAPGYPVYRKFGRAVRYMLDED